MKRVLVIAYAASPYKGSEHALGWNIVLQHARFYEVDLITEHEKCKRDIEDYLLRNPVENLTVYYVQKTRLRMLRKVWPPSYYWLYRFWHRKVFKLYKSKLADRGYFFAHQASMAGYREPGYAYKFNLPFVWGPVGGAGIVSWNMFYYFSSIGKIYYLLYNIINLYQYIFSYRPKRAANAAKILLTATSENKIWAKKYWGADSFIFPEVGVGHEEKQLIDTLKAKPERKKKQVKFLWIGNFSEGKAPNLCCDILLKSHTKFSWTIDFYGDGPLLEKCQQQVMNDDRFMFHGKVERSLLLSRYRDHDCLLVTSMRDLTSTIIAEAITANLYIFAPNHCGFKDALGCYPKGQLIDVFNRQKFYESYIEKLNKFDCVASLGSCKNSEHSDQYLWDVKGSYLNFLIKTRIF